MKRLERVKALVQSIALISPGKPSEAALSSALEDLRSEFVLFERELEDEGIHRERREEVYALISLTAHVLQLLFWS